MSFREGLVSSYIPEEAGLKFSSLDMAAGSYKALSITLESPTKLPGDTMLFKDLLRDPQGLEPMMTKVMDAKFVRESGADFLVFPDVTDTQSKKKVNEARIGIVSRDQGKGILAFPVFDESRQDSFVGYKVLSLDKAAVRDVEGDDMVPAYDFIFPVAEDGSVKVARVTKEAVSLRTITDASDDEDKLTVSIAKKLTRDNKPRVEAPEIAQPLITRDLPITVFPADQRAEVLRLEKVEEELGQRFMNQVWKASHPNKS